VTRQELQAGFVFEGIRIPFASRGAGIWRPALLTREVGAALSIMTSERGPYADALGADGWLKYSYHKGPVDNAFNQALRNAHRYRRPVIYFSRLEQGIFEAFCPVFIESDDIDRRVVHVAIDTAGLGEQGLRSGGSPEILKRYVTVQALKRLHQEQFRLEVVGAYRRACSVCSLGDEDRLVRLLDAAHILPDGDPRSLPEVSNGIALCKIHHSAYDLNILGIDPDYRVRVRQDILAKVDGPMLQHGIKAMDDRKISVPRRDKCKPNRDFLAERFEAFKAA
jgi:putative restriction endonuclease